MKSWCKQKPAVFTIEISSDDLITKFVQNIPTLYLSQSFKIINILVARVNNSG